MGNYKKVVEKETLMISSSHLYRGVEQLVARWAHNPKVTGSSPVPAIVIPRYPEAA